MTSRGFEVLQTRSRSCQCFTVTRAEKDTNELVSTYDDVRRHSLLNDDILVSTYYTVNLHKTQVQAAAGADLRKTMRTTGGCTAPETTGLTSADRRTYSLTSIVILEATDELKLAGCRGGDYRLAARRQVERSKMLRPATRMIWVASYGQRQIQLPHKRQQPKMIEDLR